MNFGDPEDLKVRAGEYGAQYLPSSFGPAPMPRQAPAAGPGAALLDPASTPMPRPQTEAPKLMAGPGAPSPISVPSQESEFQWPDWMTDDDKKYAEQSRQASRRYHGAVSQRRQDRAKIGEYRKILKERDSAHGRMKDLTGMMQTSPDLFLDEDGKTPNNHGLAVIRQLSKIRQEYKRAKQKEQDYLKQFQQSGKKLPEGREVTDDDLLAMETQDDDAFDDNIGRGNAQSVAYLGE